MTSVSITWAGVGGDVAWRVASLDPKPGDPPGFDNTPTPWVTVDTTAGSGFSTTADMIGWDAGSIVGFTVEWDVPGGFSDVCAEFTEGG